MIVFGSWKQIDAAAFDEFPAGTYMRSIIHLTIDSVPAITDYYLDFQACVPDAKVFPNGYCCRKRNPNQDRIYVERHSSLKAAQDYCDANLISFFLGCVLCQSEDEEEKVLMLL